MLELVAVRLEAVGPEAARFHGATLDLRTPDGSSLSAAHLVGPNGAGKTLLAQLTELVVIPDRSMHLLKTLLARPGLVPAGRVGQVVLEWFDGVHEESMPRLHRLRASPSMGPQRGTRLRRRAMGGDAAPTAPCDLQPR
jgi:hypothetical protein